MQTEDLRIAEDVAEQEFERFTVEMDLDLDMSVMDPEDLTSFNKQKRRIIRALRRGSLVINENGEAVYTPSNKRSSHSEPITFHERTGATIMAMDGKKKGHDAAKSYAMMAEMCKVHPSTFAKLVGEDVKVCEALFSFLMD